MTLPVEYFIGLKYLLAKRKQTFISIITVISVSGVAIGVMPYSCWASVGLTQGS